MRGLFSTAADLSRFCRMLLGGGRLGAVRILSPPTVERMTSPATPPGMRDVRGLGWDIDSSYSANRGELFPGRIVWSHRLHRNVALDGSRFEELRRLPVESRASRRPGRRDAAAGARGDGRGGGALVVRRCGAGPLGESLRATGGLRADKRPLRRASESLTADARRSSPGVDVLAAENFARLRGKRVGLLTNQTGRSRAGGEHYRCAGACAGRHARRAAQPGARYSRRARRARRCRRGDERTGLPVHSLYGDTRRPTDAMLEGIDTLVVDLQDIGARFYTFPATIRIRAGGSREAGS